jgi:hypothetical protein
MPAKGQRKPRVCRVCGETNPEKFYDYRVGECKKCLSARTSARQRGNHDLHRRRHLHRAYGITPEFYDVELAKQHGLCAMCGLPPDETDLQKILVVDHDHETGQFRGLVHGRCNSLIGYAQDNVEVLLAAARYLTRHK